jgi:hypothetical protein
MSTRLFVEGVVQQTLENGVNVTKVVFPQDLVADAKYKII